MTLLLDTHVFLWYVAADPRLSSKALTALTYTGHQLLLSSAIIWEMGIKISTGKLTLPMPFATTIRQHVRLMQATVLDVSIDHVDLVVGLPFHHRDPFDRILVAQCMAEKVPLLSSDAVFDRYGVNRIW